MKNWQEAFKEEFGIHFKDCPEELNFAIGFIEDLLEEKINAERERIKRCLMPVIDLEGET